MAAGLRSLGIGKGDPVAVFMPMVAEAVIAAYAIAKLGALYMPIFPASRRRRWRRGCRTRSEGDDHGGRRPAPRQQALMKPVADEAVAEAPSVRARRSCWSGSEPTCDDGGRD